MTGSLSPELTAKLCATLSAEELAALGVHDPPSAPARSFSLGDGAAPLPAKLRGYYKKPLAGYQETYQRGERAIKRWASAGRNATTPEPPPLDDPPRMAAWWRRHMDMNPPAVLLDYERATPPNPPASLGNPPASPDPPSSTPTGQETNRMTVSVNLSELSLEEGELVKQMSAIVKGNYAQVDAALKAEDQGAYQRWFPIYAQSAEALRKLEKELREAVRASGSSLPKAQILAELSQMLESLRLMREAMPQKILAELGKHASGRRRRVLHLIEPDLVEAVQKVRQREADLLTTVESLRSPGAARDAFTLEAA